MKYTRLAKEQFEALHQEFATFLATQTIDKAEWDTLKKEKPEVAEDELDVFSDLVWEGVLTRAKFLEHYSVNHVFLFECKDEEMNSIILKALDTNVDLLSKDGMEWLKNNMFTDAIEIRLGTKKYEKERNVAIFELVQQGAMLSEGKFYEQLHSIINSN